jgi:50S ribosomal subunit-associated GTPase HflX
VLNKIDKLDEEAFETLKTAHSDCVLLSAASKDGIDILKTKVLDMLKNKYGKEG